MKGNKMKNQKLTRRQKRVRARSQAESHMGLEREKSQPDTPLLPPLIQHYKPLSDSQSRAAELVRDNDHEINRRDW